MFTENKVEWLYLYISNIDEKYVLSNSVINDLLHKADNNEYNLIDNRVRILQKLDNTIEVRAVLYFIKSLYRYRNYTSTDNDIESFLSSIYNTDRSLIIPQSIVNYVKVCKAETAVKYLQEIIDNNRCNKYFLQNGIIFLDDKKD